MWEFLKDDYLATALSGYKLLKTAVETEGETKSQGSFLSLYFFLGGDALQNFIDILEDLAYFQAALVTICFLCIKASIIKAKSKLCAHLLKKI